MKGILFMVTSNLPQHNARVITIAKDREQAKRNAAKHLIHNPDWYEVTPLSGPRDGVIFDLSLDNWCTDA